MAPPQSTLFKKTYRVSKLPESHNEPTAPKVCALCGGAIKGGDKFLTLSVDEGGGSRRSSAGSTGPRDRSTTGTALLGARAGTKRFSGQRRYSTAVSATCHVKCLQCSQCGYTLSGPPGGVPQDDRGLLFDKGGAAAAYEEARSAQRRRSSGTRAFSVGTLLSAHEDERWVAHIFKNFVAHAKCAERICAVCGEVIHPGELQVTLPRSARLDAGRSDDTAPSLCDTQGRPKNSSSRLSQHNVCNSSKPDNREMIPQHMRCTRCSTCGRPLSTNVYQESSSRPGPSAQRPQNSSILVDDSGRPHHASCMACCCCRQPLFGRYEVHSFFGYLRMCQQALGDDPPLLPLPEGRAAALFGTAQTRVKTSLRKSTQTNTSTRGAYGAGIDKLQEFVTPVYGGLCCSWCQGRVPCCVSCERRCTVYTNASGQQFRPRALASKAKGAAELATAISLGQVAPPRPAASVRVDKIRKTAPASSIVQSGGMTSDAPRRISSSTTLGNSRATGQRSTGREGLASKNTLLKTQSSHRLKTAEAHGVLCGQCASLSVVETKEHLRSCVDTILQFFQKEGVIFSAEMMHLQHLMDQVSKESDNAAAKRPTGRKPGPVRQTDSAASASSFVAARWHSGLRIRSGPSEASGVGRKKQVSDEVKPLQQVEAAGLRVDLVEFDALNDGQSQNNARLFLSLFTPSYGWLSPTRVSCQDGSTSSSKSRLSPSGRMWESASLSVAPHPSRVTKVLPCCASPSVAPSTSSRTLAGLFTNDADPRKRPTPSPPVAGEPTKYPEGNLHALNSSSSGIHFWFDNHVLNAAVGGWKGHESSRLLFGRCHVLEVSLVVAADAAPQFDKQVRAVQRRNSQVQTAVARVGTRQLGSAGGTPATSRSSDDVALKRLKTAVPQHTFAEAAACAASVEGEDQLSRWSTATKREDESEDGGETNVAVTAGALLLKGSFAGGLVKTASGLHAQGLCVRLVKRVVVVGALPRILVLQHLAHEFIHAYLACKQKVIEDLQAEEGACNVAAAAVLLHVGAALVRVLTDSCRKPPANASGDSSKDGLHLAHCYGQPTLRSDDTSFELLLLRYRLWKMVESTDEVYGVGYRRCLQTVGSSQLTFGAFVLHLLKGWHT